MKNWKLLAAAQSLDIPEQDLARIAPALDSLEAAFRLLAAALGPETEPAVIFCCPPEDLK
jgi:hypothetical protein